MPKKPTAARHSGVNSAASSTSIGRIGTSRIWRKMSAFVFEAMSSQSRRVVQDDARTDQSMFGDASNGQARVIQAAETVLRDHQDRQFHLRGEITHKKIAADRNEPAAYPFHDHEIKTLFEAAQRGDQPLLIDRDLLDERSRERGRRSFQPDGIYLVDGQLLRCWPRANAPRRSDRRSRSVSGPRTAARSPAPRAEAAQPCGSSRRPYRCR